MAGKVNESRYILRLMRYPAVLLIPIAIVGVSLFVGNESGQKPPAPVPAAAANPVPVPAPVPVTPVPDPVPDPVPAPVPPPHEH